MTSTLNAFKTIPELIEKYSSFVTAMLHNHPKCLQVLERLLQIIQQLNESHFNEVLAYIHLNREKSPLKQAIFSALLNDRLIPKLGYSDRLHKNILRSILTANISFYDLQMILDTHPGELTQNQTDRIRQHPTESVRLLIQAGVYDTEWLTLVEQHHEQMDGNGYPKRLNQKETFEPAYLINLGEHYTALISSRQYRSRLDPKKSLNLLYKNEGVRPRHLITEFIQLIGIYPPGVFVKLANQEIALVYQLNPGKVIPNVLSLFGQDNKPYYRGISRDANLPEFKILGICEPPSAPGVDLESIWYTT